MYVVVWFHRGLVLKLIIANEAVRETTLTGTRVEPSATANAY